MSSSVAYSNVDTIERGPPSEVLKTASGHNIEVYKTEKPRPKVESSNLGFGRTISDHMVVCEWVNGEWGPCRIVPYANFKLDPASKAIHYGQEIFEGMKAYKWNDGSLALFRPYDNARRFNESAERVCMPAVPEELFVESLEALLKIDQDWVPNEKGFSMYIRPTMIGCDSFLGVAPASRYVFFTILSPSAPYFSGGFKGISIFVERDFVRAFKGGVGEAKTGGNYASTLSVTAKAQKLGFNQVLWTNAGDHTTVEEVGAATFFCVRKGVVTTPPLTGTILRGITRSSILELAKSCGYPTAEEEVTVQDLFDEIKSGDISEIFCCGTAACVTPVCKVGSENETVVVSDGNPGKITTELYEKLVGIQMGNVDDLFGWTSKVEN
ncbi:hypothetical protein P9112_005876 [Eukaryota sp. TZLM1-RC]